ncbi:MAG: N-acetylmuramoyl-L-alanine amidase family protein [Johnsonella sp.]|nr:N-acetylmuramoyl-L-alanine amidase family protein [Johnsonella sp.]
MKKIRLVFGLALLFGVFASAEAFAATKTISNVNIKVNHQLEAGDSLKDAVLNIGSSSGGDINVYTGSTERYSVTKAELNSSNTVLKIGSEPSIKVTLEAGGDDEYSYAFKGSYSSSNISINGGEFISASKKNGRLIVSIRLKPVKGSFFVPYDLKFSENGNLSAIGKASWKAPEQSSGYYDLVLYRGSNQVHSLEEYNGESYNFYPYMTSKGVYKFKVRSVPHTEEEKLYGKKSEWEYSDEYYLDEEHVSDGSGKDSRSGTQNKAVGWVKEGANWYYRFPDGNLRRNGWEKINQKWYLFDQEGKMLTGWQTKDAHTYYLGPEGDMKTGWLPEGGKWYFLKSEAGSDYEGMLIKDAWLRTADHKNYYMGSDGVMCEGWTKIGDSWYFFYPGSGYMAYNTVIDTFYLGSDGKWVK